MKKYTIINFFDGFKEIKSKNKVYKITMIIVLISISIKISIDMKSINELESYISQNKPTMNSINITSKVERPNGKFNKIKLNEIKKIYEVIGVNNITKILVDKNKLEIEGVCDNLDTLNGLRKIKYIKGYYVDRIIRDGEKYKFSIKC